MKIYCVFEVIFVLDDVRYKLNIFALLGITWLKCIQVQEIQLVTSLDQDGIKTALQKVLERVP